MKRAFVALMAALMVLSLAGVASAGEVKGPPGPGGATGGDTPVWPEFWLGEGPASICAFSGLNDEIGEEEPTLTQSYGTFVVLIMKAMDVNVREAKAILGEAPQDYCNPNRAPWGNPRKGAGDPPDDPV